MAFNVGGLPDMVIPGESGFLANMNKMISALCDALDYRRNDHLKFQEMKALCCARSSHFFSIKIQSDKYRKLYASMI